jgi:ankyrin repeat protein
VHLLPADTLWQDAQFLMSTNTLPSDDDKEDVLISCRYGDLEEIQEFVKKFGRNLLSDVRDENGNSVLHMAAGNGHTGINSSSNQK